MEFDGTKLRASENGLEFDETKLRASETGLEFDEIKLQATHMSGPLAGVRVVEIAGLGPAPFCGMVLADLGADVVRVDRANGSSVGGSPEYDVHNRGKRSIALDLKSDGGRDVVLRLVAGAEVLIEGFRPGVVERLGIGPAECLAANPRLVYTRVTGWGQTGPLADRAGHDIDYIAVSGALGSIGPADRPVVPLNLVGDFGGGGMLAAVGALAALVHARETGRGQVVDAAMVDGSALLMASHHGFRAEGWWSEDRSSNLLDGAAPFYRVYETSDGGHVAVGALEPQFFSALLVGLEIDPDEFPVQHDRSVWPAMAARFASLFESRTRDEWADHFAASDACVAPVLDMSEATTHPHNTSRGTFVEIEGVTQPAPAPRFNETVAEIPDGPAISGANSLELLDELGFSADEIGKLRSSGAVV